MLIYVSESLLKSFICDFWILYQFSKLIFSDSCLIFALGVKSVKQILEPLLVIILAFIKTWVIIDFFDSILFVLIIISVFIDYSFLDIFLSNFSSFPNLHPCNQIFWKLNSVWIIIPYWLHSFLFF